MLKNLGQGVMDRNFPPLLALVQNPGEITYLFQALTINITSFLGYADAFPKLKETILIPMLKEKPGDSSVPIRVPGCATGEEASSIAVLMKERASFSSDEG